jgi:hypothetical protein
LSKRHIASILLMLIFSGLIHAQKISIDALNTPLSEVLVQLRDSYGLSVSFDDEALRKYTISVTKNFKNREEAIQYIIKKLPLSYSINNNIFVIYPDPEKPKDPIPSKKRTIRGQVLDKKTLESLPFTNILINGKGTIADAKGYFSYTSTDSIFKIAFSQIGYYRKDTVITESRLLRILMTPSINQLKEIIVSDKLVETFVYMEKQAGVVRLNHKITKFLPGSSDNSVFNLLRLQSGILAAAEASDDLIIWGSYEGQSRILFDGFLLFGLKNFNDNISAVNPYIVKDIKLLKAGFDATYGKCVGGIADITGKDGNKIKPGAQISINNYTINSMVETPIGDNSSLLMAFRHTFQNLYDPTEIDLFQRNQTTLNDVEVIPNYTFRDFNVKYNYSNPNGTYFSASMLTGQDIFSYDIDEDVTNRINLQRTTKEENLQRGGSVYLGKNFENGWHSRIKLAYSDLKAQYKDNQIITIASPGNPVRDKSKNSTNTSSETTLAWENDWHINRTHNLSTNVEITQNTSSWVEDTIGFEYINQKYSGSHFSIILSDEISSPHISLKPGIRYTYVPFLNKSLFEPRLAINVPITKFVDLNISGGLYNQVLTKSSVEDENGNYRYMWILANESVYPILRGEHLTASINAEFNSTQISWSPYIRKTYGLTRYVNYFQQNIEDISNGKGKSYGFDFYIKQNYKGHTAWISYTLSKTEELFDHFQEEDYRFAPQDQRHEIKLATLINIDPVYFSTNYVYGSGFPIYELQDGALETTRTAYSRLDMALIYKFSFKKLNGETGISVLNVFDRENILYNNLERIPTEQSNTIRLYEESVPFTPSIYLKIAF